MKKENKGWQVRLPNVDGDFRRAVEKLAHAEGRKIGNFIKELLKDVIMRERQNNEL